MMLQKDFCSVQTEWFCEWFDSPYYHILYKHRDQADARVFITNLVQYFCMRPQDKILDLACGKGRHSIYLNQLGYQVTGVDLSEQNIAAARQFENERLQFAVHDMRQVFRPGQFNYVLNLFTSFGYFEEEAENLQALRAAAKSLKPGGILLIDFLNPDYVVPRLVRQEVKNVDGVTFNLSRYLSEDGFIVKDIRFADGGELFHFQERVKAISYNSFLKLFKEAQLELLETFGNYALAPYQAKNSERMIFVLQNKSLPTAC